MCHFLHRQLKVRLFSQAADLSLLPAWNGRLARLQRPSQGILSTTASTKRTQTLQTAWTSFWPDSSLGKVWLDCRYRIREQREEKIKWPPFPFPFTCHLITCSYFPLPHIHPSAACVHSCCVSVPPSGISHLPLASSLHLSTLATPLTFLPVPSIIVVCLPPDLTLCFLCHRASVFFFQVNAVWLRDLLSSWTEIETQRVSMS